MFLPPDLMDVLNKSSISGAEGRIHPLVSGIRTIPSQSRLRASDRPNWAGIFVWTLLLAGLALTLPDLLPGRPLLVTQRWIALRILDFVLFFSLGIVGCLILYLWLFSYHTVADGNLNLLFAFPLHLPMAIRLLFTREYTPGIKGYCLASLILTAGGLILRLFIPQYIHPLFLPLLVLIGLRCWHRIRPGISPDAADELPG
jgi:hypothetical protein